MSKKLPPPAYQEFAANTLANMHFRMMTPAQRGLCWTMKLELWVNHVLPRATDVLAKVLAMNEDEVRENLPAVMPFFAEKDGGIICPQLEDYRANLEERRNKLSMAGKDGQKIKKEKARSAERLAAQGIDAEKPPVSVVSNVAASGASTRLKGLNTVQTNTKHQSQNQSVEKGISLEDSEWVNSYERASKGQ